ncbi:hypothetical protein FRC12_010652 [Ceratobasidium sp. 428]|nr:hypothetical protein FRC12_010652 [Ceratobasidium sp. 428]
MKLTALFQIGCNALACMTAAARIRGAGALPPHAIRPRHPSEVTRTVLITVSFGPSATVTLGSDPTSSTPVPITTTLLLTTQVATTIVPTVTSDSIETLSSLSSALSSAPTTTPESSTTSELTSTSPESTSALSESSSIPPPSSTIAVPAPNPTQSFTPEPNFITDPAPSGNAVLAKNAADAQELNRLYRGIRPRSRCDVEAMTGCVGDVPARCIQGVWAPTFCAVPETACRAVPRMQTSGTALGCFKEADVLARIASTGQQGNAFGE